MTFSDLSGDQWSCKLTFAVVAESRSKLNVELSKVEHLGETWAKLVSDDQAALDVVWLIVAKDATDRGLDRATFDSRMDGNTLSAALDALKTAMIAFAPSRCHELMRSAFAKVETGYDGAIEVATKSIDEIILDAEQRFAKQGV